MSHNCVQSCVINWSCLSIGNGPEHLSTFLCFSLIINAVKILRFYTEHFLMNSILLGYEIFRAKKVNFKYIWILFQLDFISRPMELLKMT